MESGSLHSDETGSFRNVSGEATYLDRKIFPFEAFARFSKRCAHQASHPSAVELATLFSDIQTLIDETAAVTELIRRAAPKIKNLAKKQAAQNWARRGSRAFLRSLNNIQDQDKAVKLVEAKQKLEEVRKLLE